MNDERNKRKDQQHVDYFTTYSEAESEKPESDQRYNNCPKHML